MAFAPVSCFYMDEADTIYPGDEIYTNPLPPIGDVTTLTATVSGLTELNPYITITFDSPINQASVIFDTTVSVQYPAGVTTLSEGAGPGTYVGIINTSNVILDLTDSSPASGTTVRVILTTGLNADSDNSVSLSNPGNFNRLLP